MNSAAFESAPIPEIVVPPPQSYYSSTNGTSKASSTISSPPPPARTNNSVSSFASRPVSQQAPAVQSPPPKPVAPTPVSDGWDEDTSPVPTRPSSTAHTLPSMAAMSKEEKDKEMARRRDERKAVS